MESRKTFLGNSNLEEYVSQPEPDLPVLDPSFLRKPRLIDHKGRKVSLPRFSVHCRYGGGGGFFPMEINMHLRKKMVRFWHVLPEVLGTQVIQATELARKLKGSHVFVDRYDASGGEHTSPLIEIDYYFTKNLPFHKKIRLPLSNKNRYLGYQCNFNGSYKKDTEELHPKLINP